MGQLPQNDEDADGLLDAAGLEDDSHAASTSGRVEALEMVTQRVNAAGGWRSWPRAIWHIMGNETAERFSFYGMRAILVVHMTDNLGVSASAAEAAFHAFTAACYLLPLLGGWLADAVLGKYRVILYLSVFYCLGHGVLAVWETRAGLALGLVLISIGAGGIKPCVAAMVGDQFDQASQRLLPAVFSAFYWCINLGSFAAMAAIPLVLQASPFWAFSIPGLAMLAALAVFAAGTRHYVLLPPLPPEQRPAGFWAVAAHCAAQALRQPGKSFWAAAEGRFTPADADAAAAIGGLLGLFACLSAYSALFDQHSSTWVVQAQRMELRVAGWRVPPAQMQALNPVFVMLLIPLFEAAVFPALRRAGVRLSPLRKMGAGLLLTSLAFAMVAGLQALLDAGVRLSVLWQVPAYLVLTSSEVLVSTTGLEFAYSQAPPQSKSTIMSLWLLTVFAGNLLAAGVLAGAFLSGAWLFLFFAALMLCVAALFIFLARRYRMRDYAASATGSAAAAAEAREGGEAGAGLLPKV